MNKRLHRFTLLVTGATFLLIMAGALVTSHDAGLAAPDWPLSYGQVFPRMVGNLFWEHGHRLIASTVGLLVIALNVWLYLKEPRRWVRRLGFAALLVVIGQGLLGGLTVLLMLPLAVSTAHACLAQIFFCIMVSLSVFTSPSWGEERHVEEDTGNPPLSYLWSAAFLMLFLQLLLGAVLRHSATWDKHLPTNLLAAHIIGACLVTLILGSAALAVFRRHASRAYLKRPAMLVASLLILQLVLGVLTYLARRASPYDPQPLQPMVSLTVAHVACGALLLAMTVVLTLRTRRVLSLRRAALHLSAERAAT